MKRYVFCVVSVALLFVSVRSLSARKWTNDTGKFSVEAELVEAKGGNVRLRRRDGKIITIPVTKLSKDDQDFVETLGKTEPMAAKPTRAEALAVIEKLGGPVHRLIVFRQDESRPIRSKGHGCRRGCADWVAQARKTRSRELLD